jgi:hypothetical protein
VVGLAGVDHVSGHDDGLLVAEDQTFNEIVFFAFRNFISKNLKAINFMNYPIRI